ncbi:MAG: MmgE/PrpD family protein [Frankia sp.]
MRGLVVAADGAFQFAPVTGYGWTSFASAVAAGRLLRLDAVAMRHAFGLAAAATPLPTSGRFGLDLPRPMTKYGLYGQIAHGGVMAALLAHRGYTADTTVLDGERGLWRMSGSIDWDWAALTDRIGSHWLIEEVLYKRYAACRFLNPAIDLFHGIVADEGLAPADIDRVEALVPGAALAKNMDDPKVGSMVDGCFSLPYLLAVAALAGPAGPRWHAAQTRLDPAVARFAARVVVTLESRAARAAAEDLARYGHSVRMCTTVTVHAGGRSITRSTDYAAGDAFTTETRATDADVDDKVRAFATEAIGADQVARALDLGHHIEELADVEGFVASLIAPR